MNPKQRSVMWNSLIVTALLLVIGLVSYFNSSSTIIVNFVDENGTPMTAPLKTVGRTNSIYKLTASRIPGYTLKRDHYKFRYAYGTTQRQVVYHPKTVASLDNLLKAKYIGVSAQDVTTKTFNGVQSVPYDQSDNRLRILYADKLSDWHTFSINYPNVDIQDPTLFKLGEFWFIAYTGGVLRSTDLSNWEVIKTNPSKKYQEIIAPALVHVDTKTSMVFMAPAPKGHTLESFVAPFNDSTGQPKLTKAKRIRGVDGASMSASLYKGRDAYYLTYSAQDSGIIYIKKSKTLTGKYQLVRKIVPAKGSCYYAPSFALNEAGKVRGIVYSSYYYDESSDLAYNGAFMQSKILTKTTPITLGGQFAFQKFGVIKLGAD
ncbi:MucBP domain-containing protein [Levilactobacillus fujinensis]|uniref:MucBP domain-containing protein n=1 Tax=Levilactobacillus fujinensis TaxID=2486024 RepID=A0ABW1TG65_9LACO|nr:MucBP domain-containing protein [Levilactobacillus fujinensis]